MMERLAIVHVAPLVAAYFAVKVLVPGVRPVSRKTADISWIVALELVVLYRIWLYAGAATVVAPDKAYAIAHPLWLLPNWASSKAVIVTSAMPLEEMFTETVGPTVAKSVYVVEVVDCDVATVAEEGTGTAITSPSKSRTNWVLLAAPVP